MDRGRFCKEKADLSRSAFVISSTVLMCAVGIEYPGDAHNAGTQEPEEAPPIIFFIILPQGDLPSIMPDCIIFPQFFIDLSNIGRG